MLERELKGLCHVVPIMARKAAWEGSPLSQFQALPPGGRWLDEPGRWFVQMNAFGAVSTSDLLLFPNGAMQGQQNVMGAVAEVQGQWFFNPASGTIGFQFTTFMMGMPVNQDAVQMPNIGVNGPTVLAQDPLGRQFQFQRAP